MSDETPAVREGAIQDQGASCGPGSREPSRQEASRPQAASIPSRGAACPVCGDPEAFPIWVEAWGPVWGCPNEPERKSGICEKQLARARQEAAWRKAVPDAFDENGVIKPGGLALVLNTLTRDSDASLAEDAKRLSPEGVAARAEGIAEGQDKGPQQ